MRVPRGRRQSRVQGGGFAVVILEDEGLTPSHRVLPKELRGAVCRAVGDDDDFFDIGIVELLKMAYFPREQASARYALP